MQRAGSHRIYADKLLRLALELSKKKYGDYCIAQQSQSTVIRRQLLELADGRLSVAVSMPMPEWLAEAKVVQFPIMRGLASYRMFLSNSKNTEMLSEKLHTRSKAEAVSAALNITAFLSKKLDNGNELIIKNKTGEMEQIFIPGLSYNDE